MDKEEAKKWKSIQKEGFLSYLFKGNLFTFAIVGSALFIALLQSASDGFATVLFAWLGGMLLLVRTFYVTWFRESRRYKQYLKEKNASR